MYFTFMIITYNHEKFILQNLESIKYQIINYGKNHEFQLVISDDHSRDNTIKLAKKWIESNSYLFKTIDVLESETNRGTCKNYVKGIKKIKGEYFKDLAGDDIYAKDNVFEVIELLGEYDIISTPVAPFSENKLLPDKGIYSRIYSMYKFTNTKYKKIKEFNIPIPMTPGVFIKKELLTDEVLNFIERYKLIEDRSKNIKIYETNKDLKIGKHEKILVLYRHHANAVTKTKNSHVNSMFQKDSRDLFDYVNQNSTCLRLKLINYNYIILIKLNNEFLKSILNIDTWLYRASYILNYYKYKSKILKIIKNSYLPNEIHLKNILKEVKEYE